MPEGTGEISARNQGQPGVPGNDSLFSRAHEAQSRTQAQPAVGPEVPKDPIRNSRDSLDTSVSPEVVIPSSIAQNQKRQAPAQANIAQPNVAQKPKTSEADKKLSDARPELNSTSKKAIAAFLGITALVGGVFGAKALFGNDGGSGNEAPATTSGDANLNPFSAIERTIIDERGRQIDVLKPGVVGEGACGPKVDPEVIQARMTEGLPVVKPSETAAFFDKYPQMEEEFNDFYNENYGEDLLEYIFTKPVLNAEVLGDVADEDSSVARRMTARMEALTLDSAVDVQNHYCDPETGEIFEVSNINRLQEGEQVWAIPLTAGDIKALHEDEVTIPEQLVTLPVEDNQEYENTDDEVVMAILVQRLACNNPLLDRDDDETTTTTTSIPGTTSSTTTSTSSTTSSTTTTTFPEKVPVTIVNEPTSTTVEAAEEQEEPVPTTSTTSSTTTTAPPNTIESTSTTTAPTTQPPRP